MSLPSNKRHFYPLVIWLLSASFSAGAQVKPNGQGVPNAPTQTVRTVPAAYGAAASPAYVRTWVSERPLAVDSLVSSSSRPVNEVKQTTAYVDGLGRELQTVVEKISPNGFDMVSAIIYDSVGRQQVSYLPYVSPGTNGNFKLNPFAEQASFMAAIYNPTADVNGEKFFYGRTVYEPSPLNRVSTTYAPGNSWVGSARGVSRQYAVNTAADSVVKWNISAGAGVTPTSNGYYGAGLLFKTVTTDEQGNQVVEYKDKSGLVVLKKVQAAATVAAGHSGWLCSYYVYDYLDNLRWVLQPKGTEWLKANSWTFDAATWRNSTIARELCFSYEYDNRKRMTIKRVPGTGETWMVYDLRDRLVMNQDSVLRLQGKWLYTNYDSLNRPVVQGIWTTAGDISYHQNLAAGSVTYPAPGSNYTVLVQTYYDDYSWVSGSGSGLSSSLLTTYTSNTSYFYTASDASFPFPRTITATNNTLGLVTGTKVNVVNSTSYLYAVQFYDDRARMIETQSTNISGGKDTVMSQYSFSGQLLRSLVAHGKGGTNPQAYLVLTKNFYDAGGRLTAITKKVGSSLEDSVAINSYDELGRLVKKGLGKARNSLTNLAYTVNPLDTLRYVYNIRGWLRGINKDYANATGGATNWFGMELNYDFGFSASQYNGNISGTKWRNRSDGKQRAYGFSYDPVNRLTKGDFTQYNGSAWDLSNGIDFSMRGMSYDANGNILTMSQVGLKLNTVAVLDSLVYGYTANSNKLLYVTDKANDNNWKQGDFLEVTNDASTDYAYNANGSLVQDNNKKIGAIRYNHLNLADSVTVTAKGYIRYIYDAMGNKLQKITGDTTSHSLVVTKTDYLGPFNYKNDSLQFILQEEGRIRPKRSNYSDTMYYDFFIKDHLGNTRVVLTDEKQQDIYPAATVENNVNAFNVEKAYYTINTTDTISVNNIASWSATTGKNYVNNNGNPPVNNNPYANTTATSSYVYKLNGATGSKTGLGITLKVMTGDVVDIYGKSFWHSTGTNPTNTYPITSILSSFITAFAGTPAIVGAGKGATGSALNSSTTTTSGLNSWLGSVPNPGTSTVPKAYINWILFDEQFKPLSSGSGYDLTSTSSDVVKSHASSVSIGTSGFLYVYCSNESNYTVYFDNLQVIHTRGPLLETTDYYPFGITMASIASKAAGKNENRFKYNGKELQNKEFSDESGLEEYDFGARMLDVQIGRWGNADPLSDKYQNLSPYNYVANNPIKYLDPDGKIIRDKDGNIVVTTTGIQQKIPLSIVSKSLNKDGTSNASFIERTYEIVYIFADNGTPIQALRLITATQFDAVYDKNGKLVSWIKRDVDNTQYDCVADCHGYTFADNGLWINNGEVEKILENDQYDRSVNASIADLVVFKKNGNIVHSARRTKNGRYNNNAGIKLTEYDKTLDEAARGLTDIQDPKNTEYAKKKTSDKRVNTDCGTTNENCQRVITDPAEIKNFLEQLKIIFQ